MLLFFTESEDCECPWNLSLAPWSIEEATEAVFPDQHGCLSIQDSWTREAHHFKCSMCLWEWFYKPAPSLRSTFPFSGEEKVLREVRGAPIRAFIPDPLISC